MTVQSNYIVNNRTNFCEITPKNNTNHFKYINTESNLPKNPSVWLKLKEYWLNPSPLHKEIRNLASLTSSHLVINSKNNKHIFDVFSSSEFPKLRPYISKILNHLPPEQTQKLIEKLFKRSLEDGSKLAPKQLLENLQGLISLEKLEATAKNNHTFFESTRKSAKEMSTIVKSQFSMECEERMNTIKQTSTLYILSALDKAIRFTLMFLNLNNLFDDPHSPWELMYRMRIVMELLVGAKLLFDGASLLVGSAALTGILAGVTSIATGTLLFCYHKWLKPGPDEIHGCINYTKEAALGNFDPVLGRDAVVDTLVHLLGSNSKGTRTHPLLVGKSGVGKSEIIKELARRIAAGNVPDNLKDKKVFYINTSDLNDPEALALIQSEVKGNEDKIIFFFDEIHSAWKDKEIKKFDLGEKLKTLMDTNPGCFRYVIGATTYEEYKMHIAGKAPIERRVQLVPIDETNEEQTVLILNNQVYREAPNIHVRNETLNSIYHRTKRELPHLAQPAISKKIMGKAISQIRSPLDPKIAQALQVLKDKRALLSCNYLRGMGSELVLDTKIGQNMMHEIKTLDEQIEAKNEELKKEIHNWTSLNDLREKYNNLKDELFKLSIKIQKAPSSNEKEDNLLKQFFITLHYLNPAMQKAIIQRQNAFPNRQVEITETLIDEIIAKEKLDADQAKSYGEPTLLKTD
ncbi:MAG: ATP-dependent Clp protease ATP-binding subunit [Parachlamydiaceae bacterium]|nr:ATP-dependent Clp protease ATP-binding subunit [Parachlamydiaceae bacterium]